MDDATRQLVRQRAGERCEYCRMPQDATPVIPFQIEHIIAKQHHEDDSPDNLANSRDRRNAYKGSDLSSIDDETGEIVSLFHPCRDVWNDHFQKVGGRIIGQTATGRATVRLLHMNDPRRVELREEWSKESDE